MLSTGLDAEALSMESNAQFLLLWAYIMVGKVDKKEGKGGHSYCVWWPLVLRERKIRAGVEQGAMER